MAVDLATIACTSAAAAAANACGLPIAPGSLLAAAVGAAYSTWRQHERIDAISVRVAISVAMHAGSAAAAGLGMDALIRALLPVWIASGGAPGWLHGLVLVPGALISGGGSASAHLLLPLIGSALRRLVGRITPRAETGGA